MLYRFIFMFSATFTEKYLFLQLMYRAISQKEFKHKLLRFPLNCHLEKELKLILNELYQKNTDLKSIDKHVTFDSPPIKEEEKWQCRESPLIKYVHPKFLSKFD